METSEATEQAINTTAADPGGSTAGPGSAASGPEATTAGPGATTAGPGSAATRAQPLCRPIRDRMLAGVAIGIADYLGIDVLIVRIVLAVLAFVGGAGVPIYLAGWLLIPEEGAEQSIASELIQSLSAPRR